MPERRFYPYPFAHDFLTMQFDELLVDGVDIPLNEVVDREALHVGLAERVPQTNLNIGLSVSCQLDGLTDVLGPGEDPEAVAAVAICSGTPSVRERSLHLCAPDGTGHWRVSVTIAASDAYGRISLRPTILRTVDGDSEQGTSWRKGEQIADGPAAVIELDAKPFIPGNSLDNEWKDFGAEDSPPELRSRKDLAWFLDLSNEDKPKLILNEAVPGLKKALESPARVGKPARVRDAVAHSILQPVLILLAHEALRTLATGPELEDSGWRGELLCLLGKQGRGMSARAQAEKWLGDWEGALHTELELSLQTAVQRHLDFGDGLEKLLKSVAGEESDV
jgi:hypothetical protein